MKTSRLLLICAVALLASACATPKKNYTAAVVETRTQASAELRAAAPGQVVLSSRKAKEQDTLYLPEQVKISFAYTLFPGYYNKEGDDSGAEYFYPAGGMEAGKVEKALLADPWKALMLPRKGGQVCVITIFHAKVCVPTTRYERRTQPVPFDGAFEKTLVYVGAAENKVMFRYQESVNGVAGPQKSLEYDISSSRIIEFGSVRMEVLSASAEQITYKVL